jgi:hypothetical protein
VDLQLFFRVLWRFKALVACGLVLAICLGVFASARVSFSGGFKLTYRQQEQWESLSTLFVTTHGFPWGSISESAASTAQPGQPAHISRSPDASRLSSLAMLYMQLATSDAVLQRIGKTGPIHGILQTFPVYPANNSDNPPLPLITLSAIAAEPAGAQALNLRYVNAFRKFIEHRQATADIADDDRVQLQVVRAPAPAHLLQGRKMTKSIVAFMTVLIAFCGLAFILENLRPRVVRPVANDRVGPAPASAPSYESTARSA